MKKRYLPALFHFHSHAKTHCDSEPIKPLFKTAYPKLHSMVLRVNKSAVGFLDYFSYTWFSWVSTHKQSEKVAAVAITAVYSMFLHSPNHERPDSFIRLPVGWDLRDLRTTFSVTLAKKDLLPAGRQSDDGDTHCFWDLRDIELCVVPPSQVQRI